jgi:hypothetical protein
MNSKELHNLHEAYLDVYTPQEVDEAVKGASRHDTEMRKSASKERKSGIKNRLSPAAGKDNANKMQRDIKFFDKLTKKNRNVVGLVTKEEYDIFDAILEHLIAEGYADTNESALVIMANMSEEWRQSIVEGFQPVSDNAAEAMGRREKSLRPGAYPGDVGDNWKKSIKMRDAMSKTGVKPI